MVDFEWDEKKNQQNQQKHKVNFYEAQFAFNDLSRLIVEDITHSTSVEKRYFCIGRVKQGILTVRFTYRNSQVRIFGAGYWRKGKELYEQQNG